MNRKITKIRGISAFNWCKGKIPKWKEEDTLREERKQRYGASEDTLRVKSLLRMELEVCAWSVGDLKHILGTERRVITPVDYIRLQ